MGIDNCEKTFSFKLDKLSTIFLKKTWKLKCIFIDFVSYPKLHNM